MENKGEVFSWGRGMKKISSGTLSAFRWLGRSKRRGNMNPKDIIDASSNGAEQPLTSNINSATQTSTDLLEDVLQRLATIEHAVATISLDLDIQRGAVVDPIVDPPFRNSIPSPITNENSKPKLNNAPSLSNNTRGC